MVGQQVVLLLLAGAGIDGFGPWEPVGEGPQQAVDERGIVGDSVQVGSQAVPGDAAVAGSVGEACERFRRVSGKRCGTSHVNIIADPSVVPGKGEPDLRVTFSPVSTVPTGSSPSPGIVSVSLSMRCGSRMVCPIIW